MTFWIYNPIKTIVNPGQLINFSDVGDVLNFLTIIFTTVIYFLKNSLHLEWNIVIKLFIVFFLFSLILSMFLTEEERNDFEEISGMKIPTMKDFNASLTID